MFWYFTNLFRLRNPHAKFPPVEILRRKWKQWRPGSRQAKYNAELQTTTASPPHSRGNSTSGDGQLRPEVTGNTAARERTGGTTSDPEPGVDRTASVRSVMTLPAYSPAARPTEQILGREGERAGIDVVIEYPETAEEEEARRDGEMESLYQIRLARRRELEEREEERRREREARQRGDQEAIAALRQERRDRANSTLSTGSAAASAMGSGASAAMLAEHQAAFKQAERRVPSVQYGDLGVARHDGTRLRASSVESSDSRPLLDSAASFGGRNSRPDTPRRLSATSVRTASTGDDRDHDHVYPPPQLPADFVNDYGGSHGRPNSTFSRASGSGTGYTPTHSRTASASGVAWDADAVGSSASAGAASRQQTEPSPPEYEQVPLMGEDAPPYESPVEPRAPSLPLLERLPSIRIHTSSPISDGRERRQER